MACSTFCVCEWGRDSENFANATPEKDEEREKSVNHVLVMFFSNVSFYFFFFSSQYKNSPSIATEKPKRPKNKIKSYERIFSV
jgi:hypothetical protein